VSTPERSLYLYFLDRELGNAVGYRLKPLVARHAVQTLTIATNARLVCGLSLLYKNDSLDPPTVRFFGRLLEAGVLDTISHYPSYAEFLASRVTLYRDDKERYPAYFGTLPLPAINPTIVKAGGTTDRIVEGMSQWAIRLPDEDRRYRLTAAELGNPVLSVLADQYLPALRPGSGGPYRPGPLLHGRRWPRRPRADGRRGDHRTETGQRHHARDRLRQYQPKKTTKPGSGAGVHPQTAAKRDGGRRPAGR
jgi:hypothetical protein